jgi:hypothetical protein
VATPSSTTSLARNLLSAFYNVPYPKCEQLSARVRPSCPLKTRPQPTFTQLADAVANRHRLRGCILPTTMPAGSVAALFFTGHASAGERAVEADLLDGGRINAKLRCDLASALGPFRLVQRRSDLFSRSGDRRPPKPFPSAVARAGRRWEHHHGHTANNCDPEERLSTGYPQRGA